MKVLLHIGQSKTGTSAIQSFLTLNRKTLLDNKILYPSIKIRGIEIDLGSHNSVSDSLVGKLKFPYVAATEYFRQFFEEAEKNQCEKIILSGEHFFAGEPRVWDFDDEESYFSAYRQKIMSLKKHLSGCELEILVYLRPHLDWFATAVSQNIRTDGLIARPQLYKDDKNFFKLIKLILKYSALLKIWEDEVGLDKINVIPYDRAVLKHNNSISDFLFRAGLTDITFTYGVQDLKVNKSLTREFIEVKKILNKLSKTKNKERVVIKCLENLSSRSSEDTTIAISENVITDILQLAATDNEILNKKYGNQEIIFYSHKSYGFPKQISEKQIKDAMTKFNNEFKKPYYTFILLLYYCKDMLRKRARPIHAILHRAKMYIHRNRFKIKY